MPEGRVERTKGGEGLDRAAFHNWHCWDALIGKLYAIIDCRPTAVGEVSRKSTNCWNIRILSRKFVHLFPSVDIETYRCCGSFRYTTDRADRQHKYLALIAAYTSLRYSLGAWAICWQFLCVCQKAKTEKTHFLISVSLVAPSDNQQEARDARQVEGKRQTACKSFRWAQLTWIGNTSSASNHSKTTTHNVFNCY